MKSIEERVDDYCKGIFTSYEYMKPRMTSFAKACYIDGATEQKAIDDDAMHAIVEEQVLKAVEKQKAIDIKQLKD